MADRYKYSQDENHRGWIPMRTFPHSNSDKKWADRYEDDRDEALQYTNSFSTLRKGKSATPDIYDDEFIHQKWPIKPKDKDYKGKESIRTSKKFEENKDD